MRYFQVTCRLDLERQVGSDQLDSTIPSNPAFAPFREWRQPVATYGWGL